MYAVNSLWNDFSLFVYLLFWCVEGILNHVKTRENKLNYGLDSQFLTPTHPSDAADISIS